MLTSAFNREEASKSNRKERGCHVQTSWFSSILLVNRLNSVYLPVCYYYSVAVANCKGFGYVHQSEKSNAKTQTKQFRRS